ncbi:polymer-forming cytoskeletal protein [Shewanella eurypsychrophilus]|nr:MULTISPECIES: polymer-forming cytoskeletal protein [Shewanella]QFU22591.1 polymer-forming cytoskeletal family protein [Shewanella sp. YLB-09]QPG57880.1 polymer-forming cytoskeletal protein [Shewanella eurypsychrophilus]
MGLLGKNSRATGELTTTTVIAKGCHIAGELRLSGHIQIDGFIEGKMNTQQTIIVSNEGRVKGELWADKLIVSGLVEGNCYADTIQILANGKINGKIYSDNLSIELGGCFLGETQLSITDRVIEHDETNIETLKTA